ncbi:MULTISPECIES: hypothetical protein [unclassified Arthrobacter]|uniref:hypothetical protein n=1 Tax=unclassified Arthrobacter TaxID=235627 RepID=UPI002DFAD6AF|nr:MULTISPECIES: hypothetical protein [unclassified Arthrobacter]MEC5192381.1 hypothetical protein [Arthrobacter sp. MP_M4]MEC5203866.1 hypothetical protein [Arthrobacter sp. MP_M7]
MRSAGNAAGVGHCERTRRLNHDTRNSEPRALLGWVTERCWRPHGVGGLDSVHDGGQPADVRLARRMDR